MNFNFKKLVITSRDPDQLYMLFEKTCYLFTLVVRFWFKKKRGHAVGAFSKPTWPRFFFIKTRPQLEISIFLCTYV